MPRNREKDYTIRSANAPVSIDDYRKAPWQQTYACRTFDFRRWLFVGRPQLVFEGGKILDNNGQMVVHAGRDNMVETFSNTVWNINDLEPTTIQGYCTDGLINWFEYLDYRSAAGQPVYEIDQISTEVIEGFIHWLKFTKEADTETGRFGYNCAKGRYTCVKSILQRLINRGFLPEGLFPNNPFPHSNRAANPHKFYNKKVMSDLMVALYSDIKAIRQGVLQLNGSDVLALYLFMIAARTGRNTTPLLELSRDAVLPHPIRPDKLGLLVTYKRRGRTTSVQAFEKPETIEDMISLPMDVMTLYQEALKVTEPLVAEVADEHRNRLWIFRSANNRGRVIPLNDASMFQAVRRLVGRHGLTENGYPLKLNISRLRKTFAQRIWQITGGDLVATAENLGNTPAVAESYLVATPEMEANFRRLGLLMHADWGGKLDDLAFLETLASQIGIPIESLRDIAVGNNNTGVGRCTDPRTGVNAPGDGSLCTRWIECFTCPNQLVMESDLYRLFSFYFLLIKERNFISRQKWDDMYAPIIQIIDEKIIAPNLKTKQNPKGCFDPYRVRKARAEAEANPHRMWQDRSILGSVQ